MSFEQPQSQPEKNILTLPNDPVLIKKLKDKLLEYQQVLKEDAGEKEEKYQIPIIEGVHTSISQPKTIEIRYSAALLEKLLIDGRVDREEEALEELDRTTDGFYARAFKNAYETVKQLL